MNWQEVCIRHFTNLRQESLSSQLGVNRIPVDKEYGQKPQGQEYHRYTTDCKYCNPTNIQSK